AEIAASDKVWRELRFNINLPAGEFTSDPVLKEKLSGRQLLVQGVIDLFYRGGEVVRVVDFKTDSLYGNTGEEELRARHSLQLAHYMRAVSEICSAPRVSGCIYSFSLGKAVEIGEMEFSV